MKIVLWIVVFIFSLILFLPHKMIYFYTENILEKEGIVVTESVESKVGGLELKEGVVFIKGSDIARFKKARLDLFLFFNRLSVDTLEINGETIKKLEIVYSVLHPTKVLINASEINGSIDLIERNITIKSRLKTIGNINALTF